MFRSTEFQWRKVLAYLFTGRKPQRTCGIVKYAPHIETARENSLSSIVHRKREVVKNNEHDHVKHSFFSVGIRRVEA